MGFTNRRGAETSGKNCQVKIHSIRKSVALSVCLTVHPQQLSGRNHPRPITDREIRLGEKNGPPIIPESQGTSSSACICLTSVWKKTRSSLTLGEKLKLSLPCQELGNSNGETPKLTLEDSTPDVFLPPSLFMGRAEELISKDDGAENRRQRMRRPKHDWSGTRPDLQTGNVWPGYVRHDATRGRTVDSIQVSHHVVSWKNWLSRKMYLYFMHIFKRIP